VSRAFIKESEQADPRCPGCGALGEQVGPTTLNAHLPADACATLGDKAFYCVNSECDAAYFTAWGASVSRDRMKGTAYPKDPAAPLCCCFGLTASDVISDAREGRKDRVKDLVERSKGPQARCAEKCPDGQPCVTRVLQLFRENFPQP
jgi:hypothetical protein